LDRANCSADYELQDQFFSEKKEPDLTEEEQLNFKDYEFNVSVKGPLVLPSKKTTAAGSGGVMGETGGKGQLVVVNEREAKMPQHLQNAEPKSDVSDDGNGNGGMGNDSKDAKQTDFIAVHRDNAPVPVATAHIRPSSSNARKDTSSSYQANGITTATATATASPAPGAHDEPIFVITGNGTNGSLSARKTLVDDRGTEAKKSNSDNSNGPTVVVVGERKPIVARKSSASADLQHQSSGVLIPGVSSDARAELSAVRLGEGSAAGSAAQSGSPSPAQ
jgi:hypothetical protein